MPQLLVQQGRQGQVLNGSIACREGSWMLEAPMAVPRSSCGLAALQGRLFCVGGNGPNGQVR